ncbi:MAG: hypothetical protein H7Y06_08300, partial [Opitutaceae bacterium]|nr:hypothetical protein [Opitutaceae bacterium]
MTDQILKAALYLDAVLPGLEHLAPLDESLRGSASGRRTFAVTLDVRDVGVRHLTFTSDGLITTEAQPKSLRLWFPSAGQFLRTVTNRPALTLPVSGWSQLTHVRRFSAAGARLETLLNTRADAHLPLHAWGSLLVGIRATATWLARHRDGPATLARLGSGTAVFACPAFPAPLWIDLATLTSGAGEPATPVTVRITFADIATLLAELDHQLDAPAALGLGTLRIEGHLPLAENLG